jgi:hypothetical protein
MTGGIEHLDFGVRNTLLYYKDLKTTLDLTPGSGANRGAVERLLASQRVPVSELFDADAESLRNATKRVRSISYRARRDGDKGSPGTLCIAWGLATWNNGRPAVPAAPIVLRQAAVGRHPGTAEDFDLGVSGPWNLNVTLLRLLEVDFGVDVERGALGDLVEELAEHGNPQALFERVTKMAANVPGFVVAPRVVMAPVPRIAMVVQRQIAPSGPIPIDPTQVHVGPVQIDPIQIDPLPADPGHNYPDHGEAAVVDATGPVAPSVETAVHGAATGTEEIDAVATADTVELLRSGVLNSKTMTEGSFERRIVEKLGPDAVIADITATLRVDSWPEALIEHADSGLRVRDRGELLQRWYDASHHRPRPSGWDATHFALWGLAAAPPVGNPAIRSVAWQIVAEHRFGGRRGRHGHRKRAWAARRVTIPRGIDEALWGLPVDLLTEWAGWVFRLWPGAPIEFVLPAGTPELVSAWYERARPVAELAVKTWVPFSALDDDLGKAAGRWVKHLSTACDGGGAPLATWFEKSMEAATAVVAVRVGAGGGPGPHRGRRGKRGSTVTHAEHAI